MHILQFMRKGRSLWRPGEGRGMMQGVTEYIIILEEEPNDEEKADHVAPGFTLENEVHIFDDLPGWFPIDRILRVSKGLYWHTSQSEKERLDRQ